MTPLTLLAVAVTVLAIVTAVASCVRTWRIRERDLRRALMEEAEQRLLRFRPTPRACES